MKRKASLVSRRTTLWILILLVAVGAWLRLRGLGALSIWGDEAFQALAVQGILEQGYPLLPSGAVYLRGLPFQYMEALSALLFGFGEFALRLPAVVFGVLTIPAIYLLTREVSRKEVGLIAASIMCFSIWEIEMARFARMYTCLQFLYCLGLWAFYKGFIKGRKGWRSVTLLLFALTIISHQLGIFILTSFAIPFLIRGYQVVRKRVLIAWMLFLGFAGKAFGQFIIHLSYGTFESGRVNAAGGGPLDAIKDLAIPMRFDLVEQLMHSTNVTTLLFLGVTSFLLAACSISAMRRGRRGKSFFVLGVLIFSFVHQFGMALITFFAMTLVYYEKGRFFQGRAFRLTASILSGYFAFWYLYGIFEPGWFQVYLDPGMRTAADDPVLPMGFKLLSVLLHYPRIGDHFLYMHVGLWPVLTVVTFGTAVFFFVRACIHKQYPPKSLYITCIYFLPLFLLGIAKTDYLRVRYAFPVYAVMIVLFAIFLSMTARWLVRRFAMPRQVRSVVHIHCAVLIGFILCADLNLGKAYGIGQRTHATPFDPVTAFRKDDQCHRDHRSAGRYVKQRRLSGDLVISFSGAPDYIYAGPIDYYFVRRRAERDIFTRAMLFDTVDEFRGILKQNADKRIWIVGYTYLGTIKQFYGEDITRFVEESLASYRVYLAEDGQTPVYLIEPTRVVLGGQAS